VPTKSRAGGKTKGLQTSGHPEWIKAPAIMLAADASMEAAFAVIATACRNHWHANIPAALAGEHPEGIHQVRVGLRRFRVLLTLYGEYLPGEQLNWLKAEAKALADGLGPVRDLDVFLNDLIEPLNRKASDDADVAVLLRTARRAREEAHGAAGVLLTSARYRRFMTRLNTWISGQGWRAGGRLHHARGTAEAFARDALNRRLAKIVKRSRSIKDMRPAKMHDLRIAIKKLRYGLEFFQTLLPHRRAVRAGHTLKSLPDSLGRMNDLDVAKRTVALLVERAGEQSRAAVARGGERLSSLCDTAADEAIPRAAKAAARLAGRKPL
jgi:CHAD domain-containing protein